MAEPGLSLLLDGRALGGAARFRGLGTYVRELVEGLEQVDSVNLTVLAAPDAPLPSGVARVALAHKGPDRWATAEHHTRLALALRRRRPAAGAGAPATVFHAPAQDPPRRVGVPWVQTVADVLPLVRDDPAYLPERRRWRRWAGRVRSADAVVTFSRHAADQVSSLLDVEPARIHVIPLAAGNRFRPAPDPAAPDPGAPDPGAPDPGAPDPGAPDPAASGPRSHPFVLSVGEYAPHKGYAELAELAAALEAAGLPHRVVIAGRIAAQWDQARQRDLSAAGPAARGRIELADWVPDLVGLYQQAAAFVSTSRHEGFGLPLVEAMASGCPVVAFANSAVTEVVGDGGVLVGDGDVTAMAEAVIALTGDDSAARSARQSARQAALRRSAAFSWEATVAAHVDVYRSVLAAR